MDHNITLTSKQIAELVQGRLVGQPDINISGIQAVDLAEETHITMIGSPVFAKSWPDSKARVAIISNKIDLQPESDQALIFVDNVQIASIKILTAFNPPQTLPDVGVHPAAFVDPTATVQPSARIGPGSVVGPNVTIGQNTILHGNVTIMANATIGDDCELYPGVVISERCHIGNRCCFFGNVIIGADGFGYVRDPKTKVPLKIPQIGNVQIGSDCEFGAAVTIDRGKFAATIIGNHCKFDNQVHIGHNCIVGNNVIIAGCTAVAGSVTIKDNVTIGGQSGICEQITVGENSILGGISHLHEDIPPGAFYAGTRATHLKTYLKIQACMKRLPDLMNQVKEIQKKLEALSSDGSTH